MEKKNKDSINTEEKKKEIKNKETKEKEVKKREEEKKGKEIFLDDNLMIKKDLSDFGDESEAGKSKTGKTGTGKTGAGKSETEKIGIRKIRIGEFEAEESETEEHGLKRKDGVQVHEEMEEIEQKSVLLRIESVLESVSGWFAEKYEQIREIFREPDNDLDSYKYRQRKEKLMRALKIAGITFVALLIVFMTKYFVDHHSYESYVVVANSEKVDTGISHFVELDGKLLHYSADGVALASATDELIWSDSYQMSQPIVETFQSVVVIYDLKGTQIHVYDSKGKLGAFQTEYPIMKAGVSSKGTVAAILENGETTLVNYYTETGSLIASSSTNMRNPGYPVDVAVSKDGLSVVVTYFVTDEDSISSYIAFYNFGDAGRKKEDNLIGGVRCAGVLVPEVQYLDNKRVIAYTEEGFKIFKIKSEPEAIKEVIFEEDIVSSFGNDKYIGFIFRNNNVEKPFLLKLFDSAGNLEMETEFDILYDDVKISGNKIILNNATQVEIFSLKGIEKYSGTIEEGNIHEIVKIGMNKYVVVYNGGVVTIKLK